MRHLLAGAMLLLCDRAGMVLDAAGDTRIRSRGEENHLHPGGLWDEGAIGTNAIVLTRRTDDEDDAAIQRLARPMTHALPASATMRANSPDSCSSMVMSQPPISSPLMNSWGKVGQLE